MRSRRQRPCPAGPATSSTTAPSSAFLSGTHLAVTIGAMLAFAAAVIVLRYLPRRLASEGAMHGPAEAIEDAAELGLAGIPPVFPDGPDDTAGVDADEVTTGQVPRPTSTR